MENTALWDKLGKTDPEHTKRFKRAGGFSGTAIKPMWSFRRMTEEFGPCGTGWGINEPKFDVVTTGESVMVYCTVSVWYGNHSQAVFGVGGDMIAGKRGNYSMVDDEAFKKAFTDAVTNALKLIGVGADVHMGLFDDSKYVDEMKREFGSEEEPRTADRRSDTGRREVENQTRGASKNDDARKLYSSLEKDMRLCESADDLARWWKDSECVDLRSRLPGDWQRNLRDEFASLGKELRKKEGEDFPGSTPANSGVRNGAGRELHSMEAL